MIVDEYIRNQLLSHVLRWAVTIACSGPIVTTCRIDEDGDSTIPHLGRMERGKGIVRGCRDET